ncbi:MAG: SdpI family protein [Chloroflexota bacterium]
MTEQPNNTKSLNRIAIACIGIMLIVSAVLYPSLPETLPRQWGIDGEVNSTWHKNYAVLVMPALAIGIYLLTYILPMVDPRRDSYEKFRPSYERVRIAVLVMMAGFHILTLTQYDNPQMLVKLILFGVSLLFVFIGNEMGRFRQTWFAGIRTPWTLADERVWKKTHRVGARWFVAVGLLNMALVFVLPMNAFFVVFMTSVIGVALGTSAYSYVLYRRWNG